MTSQDKLFYNIVGGPSKFDLMLSLFDGNKSPRRTVEFKLQESQIPITVAITSVQQENGSGESWNILGEIVNSDRGFKIDGYFSTKARAGWLTISAPFHYVVKDGAMHKVINPESLVALERYVDLLRR